MVQRQLQKRPVPAGYPILHSAITPAAGNRKCGAAGSNKINVGQHAAENVKQQAATNVKQHAAANVGQQATENVKHLNRFRDSSYLITNSAIQRHQQLAVMSPMRQSTRRASCRPRPDKTTTTSATLLRYVRCAASLSPQPHHVIMSQVAQPDPVCSRVSERYLPPDRHWLCARCELCCST